MYVACIQIYTNSDMFSRPAVEMALPSIFDVPGILHWTVPQYNSNQTAEGACTCVHMGGGGAMGAARHEGPRRF
jgi:hypothetical protein